eukprot:TRINITY_DN6195_c0_g1_i1.p1 TRINITY_DN6195_c0_g1~~TRINITY_DN6195_c0_g1_i1.p1  ORF type:complete len:363 (+),score=57.54 TRINITY_DN6195_c0_g1_i1:240-1328(+)
MNQPEGLPLIEFKVSHMHVYGEGGWMELTRQRQLQDGVQIYAFQERRTEEEEARRPTRNRRGRSTSPNYPPSPRSCQVEGARRAFIDKIRCVFQALSNSSDKIKVSTLEESIRQRGIACAPELTISILQGIDQQFYMNLTHLSLAQFTRWGRKHPVDVDLLYSKCDVLRWATPVKSRKRSLSARGAPEAAVSPVPLPPTLPIANLNIPPPSPRVSAPLPSQLPMKAVMAQSILGDPSVVASPPKMFHPASIDPIPPVIQPIKPYSSSIRRASGGCRTLSPEPVVLSPPVAVPPPAVMPPSAGLPLPQLQSPSSPIASPLPLAIAGAPPLPKPWESWLGTEIKRLEAEHQAKVASLYARLNRQ